MSSKAEGLQLVGRGSSSLEHLVFVVACATRGDCRKCLCAAACPALKTAGRLKPLNADLTKRWNSQGPCFGWSLTIGRRGTASGLTRKGS